MRDRTFSECCRECVHKHICIVFKCIQSSYAKKGRGENLDQTINGRRQGSRSTGEKPQEIAASIWFRISRCWLSSAEEWFWGSISCVHVEEDRGDIESERNRSSESKSERESERESEGEMKKDSMKERWKHQRDSRNKDNTSAREREREREREGARGG